MLLQVAMGRDPMAERSARREAPTVAELVDHYWDLHASKQKASRGVHRHLDRHFVPLLVTKRGKSASPYDIRRSTTLCDRALRRAFDILSPVFRHFHRALRRALVIILRRVSDTSILRSATECFLTAFEVSFFRRLELARSLRHRECAGGVRRLWGGHCRL